MQKSEKIYKWLRESESIVITAGAGMGADSGLGTYRGTNGQWGKIETEKNKSVFEVINPALFSETPKYGWSMFASRLIEYANNEPHTGFKIILNWIKKFKLDYFVLTSNVDNQFQKSGFSHQKIRELHGSLFHLQCSIPCSGNIWKHNINLEKILSEIKNNKFPVCPKCGKISRPNVYMFRDNTYLPHRSDEQEKNFQKFLEKNKTGKIIVFEIGSGPHVQSIRKKTRKLGIDYNAKIIRINPKDYKIKAPHIGINKGALEALTKIDNFIKNQE